MRQPSAIMPLPPRRCGSAGPPTTSVVVADLSVSRYHAELRRARGGYEIADLGSHNGTFVNGQRITSAAVTETDVIGIGRRRSAWSGDELQEFIDAGDVSLDARDLTVSCPAARCCSMTSASRWASAACSASSALAAPASRRCSAR